MITRGSKGAVIKLRWTGGASLETFLWNLQKQADFPANEFPREQHLFSARILPDESHRFCEVVGFNFQLISQFLFRLRKDCRKFLDDEHRPAIFYDRFT